MTSQARALVAALLLLLPGPALSAQPRAERDWSATLRTDAQALHDDIAANHPGPVNPEDPGFAGRNDAQLALALERARDARSYADYFFALRQYVAAFDDGHMGFGVFGATPNHSRWPGFATQYDGRGEIRVFHREADAPVPLGARLVGCDGLSAERYAAATLGRMWGRWQLEAQHRSFGRMLFLDEGSRYIPQARRCTFESDGVERTVALSWRPIGVEQVRRLAFERQGPLPFEARSLADGTLWYAIPSFDANPQSAAGRALPPMIERMRSDRAALARAPAIVLDLRGNGGGSSDWSRQIAEILWGRAAIDALPPADIQVYWRASAANLAAIEQGFVEQGSGGQLSPEIRHWFEAVIRNMRAAVARGDQLWRHVEEQEEGGAPPARAARPGPPPPLAGPVYLVTDSACGSACLDAVDLWRALGAIHVGRTTSADTLYMEARQFRLPSGIGAVSMPMKVYRGRPRGSNQPVVPAHIFEGDINDTPALERWIATLAPARPG